MKVGNYDLFVRSSGGKLILAAYRPAWASGRWLWVVVLDGAKLKRVYNPMLRAKI